MHFHTQAVKSQPDAYSGMFPGLRGWKPQRRPQETEEQALLRLADAMLEAPYGSADHGGVEEQADNEVLHDVLYGLNSSVPAGYTYFGQFIAHDITFDPFSHGPWGGAVAGRRNLRDPLLNLDNLYGDGPLASPWLYRDIAEGCAAFRLSLREMHEPGCEDHWLPDFPRTEDGVPYIVDPRNDDTTLVAQLQLVFMLAHNRLVDQARQAAGAGTESPFERASRSLRWLYQYLVWNDFCARLMDPQVHAEALQRDGQEWQLGFKRLYAPGHFNTLPLEFARAAFRFGHSMVRTGYRSNDGVSGLRRFLPVFLNHWDEPSALSLSGRCAIQPATSLQWDWFFELDNRRPEFPQRARKINTRLSYATFWLGMGGATPRNLAYRNLRASLLMGMPAGSAVAEALQREPLRLEDEPDTLWYYILKEAEQQQGGERLGAVGSTIVCATLAGLLKADRDCYLNACPDWRPEEDELLQAAMREAEQRGGFSRPDGDWKVADVIRLSGVDFHHIGIPR